MAANTAEGVFSRIQSIKQTSPSNGRAAPDGMAKLLGWFSIGLGLAEMAAPRGMSRTIGAGPDGKVLPFFGAREIAAGLGILAGRRPGEWLWGRVAGDAVDLAYLWSAYQSQTGDADRKKLIASMAAVAGVTVLDVVAAYRHVSESDV
ncbi:MAG: hypothetical protein K2X38_13465 [Gemmataceae bacterium]|nr:hypothetical protein [Gemmataceae bacterium]